MPAAKVLTLKEPVEKLPLAARKNLRDEFEAKRADFEEQISKLLGGESWKIDVNPNLLYAYAEDGSYGQNSPGSCITSYIEGVVYRLQYFIESQGHGAEGAAEINKVAYTHTITIYPDLEKKNSYCGVDIKDGVLRVLFAEGNLGTNVNYALEKLEKALNDAAADTPGLPYTARNSIKQEWEPHVEELQEEIAKQTHNSDIKLNPNFEAVAEKLSKGGKDVREDWPANIGSFMKNYFESLTYYLKYNKFEEDDLMYEGFNEAVSKSEVTFRIVDKLTGSSSYNQCLIEDGVFIMQTTPQNFGTNITYTCEKMVDLL